MWPVMLSRHKWSKIPALKAQTIGIIFLFVTNKVEQEKRQILIQKNGM
jgi:hypothetical protein